MKRAPGQAAGHRDIRMVEIGLLATMFFASLPLAWTLQLRLGGIPVMNVFYAFSSLASLFLLFSRVRGGNGPLLLYIGATLYFVTITFLYSGLENFDSRAAIQDFLAWIGLPVGVIVARALGYTRFQELLWRCYVITCAAFFLNLSLLRVGIIQSSSNENRSIDGAMYASTFVLLMSFPCVWSWVRLRSRRDIAIALSGPVFALYFAISSATRSVLIILMASLVCTFIVAIRRNGRNAVWLGIILVVGTAAVVAGRLPGVDSVQNTYLGERMVTTTIEDEDRFDELRSMLDDMDSAAWLHGVGFGTSFTSKIGESGTATVPHIGITAPLYKGGIIALVLLFAGPLLICVARLFLSRRSERDPFYAAVTIYLVTSCLSGGWSFIGLLLLGACLHLAMSFSRLNEPLRQAGRGKALSAVT